MQFRNLVIYGALFGSVVFCSGESFTGKPHNLKLERATYHKISFKWESPTDGTQIAFYRVYRNGVAVSEVTQTEFIDSELNPGTNYQYQVEAVAVGGAASEQSLPIAIKTLDAVEFDQHQQVESVVDSLHELPVENLTALSLFSAVKAAFESLTGSGFVMNTFDSDLISDMIREELELIRTAAPEWTDAERIAAQAELDQCLQESFGGNSMEQVYLYDRLTTLAEAHWEKGNAQAATLLYEFSLKFLSNQEASVSNTLNRLAAFKIAGLTDDSTADEIQSALTAHATEKLRFLDFFPESRGNNTRFLYTSLAATYFRHFPKLLGYEDYRQAFFEQAMTYANRGCELFPDDDMALRRKERVAAWELIRVKLKLRDPAGNPRRATVKVANVTAESGRTDLFPSDPYYEERTFEVDGEAEIPVYAGHIYEITANIRIPGGSDLVQTLPLFPQKNDSKTTYDTHGDPVQSPSADGPAAEIVVADSDFPYNLRFERNIDVFTLSWDWVDGESFNAVGFKVFHGSTEIASVVGTSAANIRLAALDGNYTYTVAAVDAAGNLSRASRPIVVEPGDQTAHAEFFAWLQQYFGDLPVLSTDDTDGDGVDNYHEFLNGTDPSLLPEPTPAGGQVTYTKISLVWECAPELLESSSWTVRRDGVEVGTVVTPAFTDSGLIPGMEYRYTIRRNAAGGAGSDWSAPLLLKTQKPETVSYGETLQQVVDLFNPLELADYTAPSLISAVKSSVESILGTNITFTVVDQSLLEQMVESELELLREVSTTLTASERLALRGELTQMMNENFGGNSFEHMYINSKLGELAEEHWSVYLNDKSNLSHRTAAEALLDASLGFLSNHEPTVSNTLSRLAAMQWQALDDNSTREEVRAALDKQCAILMRYFEFFETFDDEKAIRHPYTEILYTDLRFFPRMLAYDNYDDKLFANAMQIAHALKGIVLKRSSDTLIAQIAAWNLVPLTVRTENGGVETGTLTVRNVSDRLPNNPLGIEEGKDVRQLALASGETPLPVYGGHWYELELVTPVPGGADWKRTIGPLFFPAGEKVIFDSFAGISRETLPAGAEGAELAIRLELPLSPYNLNAERLPDVMTLNWDWTAPAGFTLDHFNVYRGDTLVGSSGTQSLAGIPRTVTEDGSYAYTVTAVSANGAETRRSPVLQVLPEFTADEQAYFDWKFKYFGDTPTLATDDPDGDGLTNYQEYQLGSNPLQAPPASENELNIEKIPGAAISYYEGTWSSLPKYDTLKAFKSDVLTEFRVDPTTGTILTSGLTQHMGMVLEGYFTAPSTGSYKFYMANADGCVLYLDGTAVLTNNRQNSPQEYMTTVYLKGGIHAFRIAYYTNEGQAKLQVDWSGEFTRCRFDGSGIFHTDSMSPEFREYLAWRQDSDSDGLSDAEELRIGTDPKSKDSDGDGLTDFDEVNQYHTNPLNSDTNGDGISDYDEINLFGKDPSTDLGMVTFDFVDEQLGSNFTASRGLWSQAEGSAVSEERRGELVYEFQVENGNIFKLEFLVRSTQKEHYGVDFDFYIDDIFCETKQLELTETAQACVFFTPYLSPGTHHVRFAWDNYRPARTLLVDRMKIYGVKSLATEEGSQATLLEKLLSARNTVAETTTSSRVSPYCLEGGARYPELVRVDGTASATRLSETGWYAELPLKQNGVTTKGIDYENGGYHRNVSVRWEETDLFAENGNTIKIRKGDSLLLTAIPEKAKGGSWRISGNGVDDLQGTKGTAAAWKFDQAGSTVLTGTYTSSSGETSEASITVEAVEYAFARPDVACWLGWVREWQIPAPPEGVAFTFDGRLSDAQHLTSGETHSFKVFTDDNQPRYAAARLGESGPVLAVQRISGVGIYSSYQTAMQNTEIFDDGSKEFVMDVICSPVRSDMVLKLDIFVAGVVFDDGTVSKTLRAEDFNDNGIARVTFIRSVAATTSTCHNMRAYQNNEYIGVRTR